MLSAPERVIEVTQFVSKPRSEVFAFFSDAKNLERITPSNLSFKILKQSTPNIQEGTVFDYQLRIHGVPIKWQSQIIDWKPDQAFVDIQLKGPYAQWHHTHTFKDVNGGTQVKDRVRYQLRGGAIGDALIGWWVKKDVSRIFAYRQKVIEEVLS